MKSTIRAASLLAVFIAPALAQAAVYFGNNSNKIDTVATTILITINYVLVPVIFAVSFIVFLYGVAKTYIFSVGGEEVKTGHKLILWGIIGFVVMISLWGIVNVVSNTFGLSGAFAPELPESTNGINSQSNPNLEFYPKSE